MLRPDVDTALASVIERAMARDPGWRFGSANEMRAALASRIGAPVRPATRVLAAPLPDPTTMVVAPAVRRNRSRLLLGLAAVVLAVLVAAVAFIVDSASRPAVPAPARTSASVPRADANLRAAAATDDTSNCGQTTATEEAGCERKWQRPQEGWPRRRLTCLPEEAWLRLDVSAGWWVYRAYGVRIRG